MNTISLFIDDLQETHGLECEVTQATCTESWHKCSDENVFHNILIRFPDGADFLEVTLEEEHWQGEIAFTFFSMVSTNVEIQSVLMSIAQLNRLGPGSTIPVVFYLPGHDGQRELNDNDLGSYPGPVPLLTSANFLLGAEEIMEIVMRRRESIALEKQSVEEIRRSYEEDPL